MNRRRGNEQKLKFNQAVNKAERSKDEIETEFLELFNPRSKTIVIEIESNKTERKRSEFSFPKTKKLKITQYPKLSGNYYENSKRKSSLKNLNSILFIHFLTMIFKP